MMIALKEKNKFNIFYIIYFTHQFTKNIHIKLSASKLFSFYHIFH